MLLVKRVVCLFACIFIVGGFAQAQQAVKHELRDFTGAVLDLRSEIRPLTAKVDNVGGSGGNLAGAVSDLNIKETELEVKVELSGDILFDFDKWDIRKEAEPTLKQVGDLIQKYPKAQVLIEGYTDAKGSDSYNLNLSRKRADSVKTWFVARAGAEGRYMSTKGWGEEKPVAPNMNPDGSDNPGGRQKNRRVEITVKKVSSGRSA